MYCEVDGSEVRPEAISHRELGFGQSVEIPTRPYIVMYGIAEACGLLASSYAEWIEEMKADNERTGDTYPEWLHALGYPSLDVIARRPVAFGQMIQGFLYANLFRLSLAGQDHESELKWIINDIRTATCQGGMVVVRGAAYRKA